VGWLGTDTTVVIVADGAEWIWRRAAELFPRRCEILDFWHAVEHAWVLARDLFAGDAASAGTWVHTVVSTRLRRGEVGQVIQELLTLARSRPEHREAIDGLRAYYEAHQHRMDYPSYVARGYGIGSGAVESAHKQVVHARLRQAGMRWSEAGARRLLAVRVLLLNGSWGHLGGLALRRAA